MLRADATIVWVDSDSTPHAEDYYLSNYVQVSNNTHTHTLSLSLCIAISLLYIVSGREWCLSRHSGHNTW